MLRVFFLVNSRFPMAGKVQPNKALQPSPVALES